MKSSQCRLILHTVSALGPRSHGIAPGCYTIDYSEGSATTLKAVRVEITVISKSISDFCLISGDF